MSDLCENWIFRACVHKSVFIGVRSPFSAIGSVSVPQASTEDKVGPRINSGQTVQGKG